MSNKQLHGLTQKPLFFSKSKKWLAPRVTLAASGVVWGYPSYVYPSYTYPSYVYPSYMYPSYMWRYPSYMWMYLAHLRTLMY